MTRPPVPGYGSSTAPRGIEAETARRAGGERPGGIDDVITNARAATNGTVAVTPADARARVVEVDLAGVFRTASGTPPHVVAGVGRRPPVSAAAAASVGMGDARVSE